MTSRELLLVSIVFALLVLALVGGSHGSKQYWKAQERICADRGYTTVVAVSGETICVEAK